MPSLIILRGNSGSGKTTLAKALQKRFGRGTMLISQDVIRRDMLMAKDGEKNAALPLLIDLMTYGSRHCETVILEGILASDWYRELFETALFLYGSRVFAYYFDIPFEETMKRHQMKPNRAEFGEKEMRSWWLEKDYADLLSERTLTSDETLEAMTEDIYRTVTETNVR